MTKKELKQLINECISEVLMENYNDIQKIWFTPDGKIVNAGHSHEEWILRNTNIPKGYTLLDTYDNATKKGYVRGIFDGGILTLSNLPNYDFDLKKLSKYTKNAIEDYVVNKEIRLIASGKGKMLKNFMFDMEYHQ